MPKKLLECEFMLPPLLSTAGTKAKDDCCAAIRRPTVKHTHWPPLLLSQPMEFFFEEVIKAKLLPGDPCLMSKFSSSKALPYIE